MTPRSRMVLIALLVGLVVAGGICAALVGGVTGEVLTIVLISTGLGGALLLVFFEIGLGEERDLAREEQARRKRDKPILDARRRALRSQRRRRE